MRTACSSTTCSATEPRRWPEPSNPFVSCCRPSQCSRWRCPPARWPAKPASAPRRRPKRRHRPKRRPLPKQPRLNRRRKRRRPAFDHQSRLPRRNPKPLAESAPGTAHSAEGEQPARPGSHAIPRRRSTGEPPAHGRDRRWHVSGGGAAPGSSKGSAAKPKRGRRAPKPSALTPPLPLSYLCPPRSPACHKLLHPKLPHPAVPPPDLGPPLLRPRRALAGARGDQQRVETD